MFSLRAAARRAPQAAARLTTTSLFRPAFRSTFLPSVSRPQPLAAFSSCRIFRDEHAQHLAAKLTSEIELESEETSTAAGSDNNIEAFRAQFPDWDFSGDVEGSQDVFLTRKYEDETITVHFSVADFNTNYMHEDEMDQALADEEDMDLQSGGANTKGAINQGRTSEGNFKQAPEDSIAPADRDELIDDEDQPQPFPVSVSVLIQKSGTQAALKFILTASDQHFELEQLVHVPNASGDVKELLRSPADDSYAGPPFSQLDEEMQGILESYLNARGLDSTLASVIPDYVDVKEQREYLGWLGRVKDFVDY